MFSLTPTVFTTVGEMNRRALFVFFEKLIEAGEELLAERGGDFSFPVRGSSGSSPLWLHECPLQ
jgi:hypothetical protein